MFFLIKYRIRKRFSSPCEKNISYYLVSNDLTKSVYTRAQIAIAVLHDLSSSKVLQPVKFLLQNEEWKDLLNKLEKVQLIRLLPNKETRILFSYEFSRPLLQISLLNVLQAINIATYRYTSVSRNYHTLVWLLKHKAKKGDAK